MYSEIYQNACQNQDYQEHLAGDLSGFRYPHLRNCENLFSFSQKLQTYMYHGDDSDIMKVAQEDITVYEFLSEKARKLHLSDMLGCKYGEEDKEAAMDDLLQTYCNRAEIFKNASVSTVSFADFDLKEGYEYLKELYQELLSTQIKVFTLPKKTFPFGSVLKGTNIIITDQNKTNLGQDLVHMLFHLQEGIPGKENDNEYVKEIWADVPKLYAFQLQCGRMGRRIRLKNSPHLIHFQDYIYLRAYLGQCMDLSTPDALHPVYRLIEPALQFIFYALKDKSLYDQNRMIADAILCDKTEELVSEFDACFGVGSFRCIYGTYSIYDKYHLALQFMSKEKVEEIMFKSETRISTTLDPEFVEEFWRKRLNEDSIMLPACLL